VVHPSARVSGGSTIAARSNVEARAHVQGSVLGERVSVGMGTQLVRCLVGPGAQIGPKCTLTDAVIGAGASIGAHNDLAGGIRVWTDAIIPDAAIRFSPLP
jgi:mannose-1-phosphate guanylyltransferase